MKQRGSVKAVDGVTGQKKQISLHEAIEVHKVYIMKETLCKVLEKVDKIPEDCYIEEHEINGMTIRIGIRRVKE